MKNIRRMINKTILEITFLFLLCIVSVYVFSTCRLDPVEEDFIYTDINVVAGENYIGINDFPTDSRIKITISNMSNTNEDYNVLLTSESNLSFYEDYLKIKIDDKEYILKDLKVADNYFLIDKGRMKATTKEISLYFAMDEEHSSLVKPISFEFVNDLSI